MLFRRLQQGAGSADGRHRQPNQNAELGGCREEQGDCQHAEDRRLCGRALEAEEQHRGARLRRRLHQLALAQVEPPEPDARERQRPHEGGLHDWRFSGAAHLAECCACRQEGGKLAALQQQARPRRAPLPHHGRCQQRAEAAGKLGRTPECSKSSGLHAVRAQPCRQQAAWRQHGEVQAGHGDCVRARLRVQGPEDACPLQEAERRRQRARDFALWLLLAAQLRRGAVHVPQGRQDRQRGKHTPASQRSLGPLVDILQRRAQQGIARH
mmetsp:Transcript_112796/g.364147  ORF Transcript_112796/g.364147 Transcript_112796/m.364147 type:complete len:268 (-) Transcript_112796:730-1533(-)